MYAIVDCDNCYVSCERVFRPDLAHRAVVVLSNNDGCVVARSKEAKALGIRAGLPYFQLREKFSEEEVVAFSSNYELYADITQRVMTIIEESAPTFYRYSIDEAFCDLQGMDYVDLKRWGEDLHLRVLQEVGMPVSIGIAPTKTLAKMASHYAKKYDGYKHCCFIDTDEKRQKALSMYPIDEVWGVGRRISVSLKSQGVMTALDLTERSRDWVQRHFSITLARTWQELRGEDCIPNEDRTQKKSICTSRSFPHNIKDFSEVRTLVSKFASRCAEKLRKQKTVAATVAVFIDTNHFREDLPQYGSTQKQHLLTADNSTQVIVAAAVKCLEQLWREGYEYKRAGVIVSDITPADAVQTNLFDYDSEQYQRRRKLDEVVDKINRREGSETVVIASEQSQKFSDSIRHDLRSPNYTTRWNDIIEVQ